MADNHTPDVRSYNMSRIKNKNTKPEEIVRKFLFSKGLRYRKNDKRLPGHPDIVLPKYKTVIFVNGCFWHGHEGCRYYVLPKSNTEFWKAKIERNRERDLDRRIKLRDMGWHVIQFWECQLKPKVREENLQGLLYTLHKIMLLNYQPKPYRVEETPMTIAAEKDLEYRKNALSLSPETDKKA
jgi:DNA mismatch endonuclease (patch repair protein)